MEYTIKAIPTTYKGVKFRSRLEARWAVMFDKLGWHWRYEPLDLDGWIPDFIINDVLPVEVKPYLWANSADPTKFVTPDLHGKIHDRLALIVGADFRCGNESSCTNDLFPMGVLVGSKWWRREYPGWKGALDRAVMGDAWHRGQERSRAATRIRYDICEDINSWETRFNGFEKGPEDMADVDHDLVEAWWIEAGNVVQYQHKSRV
jgi:hypothetical protein